MRISTKGGGIIKAQQGTIARPNPKENYKLPEISSPNRQLKGTDIQEMRTKGAKIPSGFNTLNDDEIAKLHNTFASNTINKRSNTMLIAKRGVQIKRRIIK